MGSFNPLRLHFPRSLNYLASVDFCDRFHSEDNADWNRLRERLVDKLKSLVQISYQDLETYPPHNRV